MQRLEHGPWAARDWTERPERGVHEQHLAWRHAERPEVRHELVPGPFHVRAEEHPGRGRESSPADWLPGSPPACI